jgi:4-hydroxyproline epimerase
MTPERVTVIDTHTGGEPTRVVITGGPDLGRGSLAERRTLFRDKFDEFRSAVVNEPRGSDVMVGALLVEPVDPASAAGVIFFNNVGVLNMCGHGTIGVIVALGHLGRIGAGKHRLETPVGNVEVEYDGANVVSFENVPSFRYKAAVKVGHFVGDVAWGGNWFFIVHDVNAKAKLPVDIRIEEAPMYTHGAKRLLSDLRRLKITGEDGAEIDHIELCVPLVNQENHSRNFVLCPGLAYDRSPCGTGTSAKIACLAADGKLKPGEIWRQESIIGSVFEASYRRVAGSGDPATAHVIPRIKGTAYVTGEATLLLDPRDPFVRGIRP